MNSGRSDPITAEALIAFHATPEPDCPVGCGDTLDTGYECNCCGYDAIVWVHLREACERRGERMHPSGLYESELRATRSESPSKAPAKEVGE